MSGELVYATADDFGRLVALLDERRRMVRRHALAKRRPGRQQMTLAEKLAVDRHHKAELAELNRRIAELTVATGGNRECTSK